jgi:hypothetical protein
VAASRRIAVDLPGEEVQRIHCPALSRRRRRGRRQDVYHIVIEYPRSSFVRPQGPSHRFVVVVVRGCGARIELGARGEERRCRLSPACERRRIGVVVIVDVPRRSARIPVAQFWRERLSSSSSSSLSAVERR